VSSDQVHERVLAIVSGILEVNPAHAPAMRLDQSTEWDSLRHIEIILAVEDEFGVTIPEDDFSSLSSVDAIESHLVRLRAPR